MTRVANEAFGLHLSSPKATSFLKPTNLLLSLVLVGSMGTGVQFMQPSFWLVARWALLVLLTIGLVVRGQFRWFFATPTFWALAAVTAWSGTSALWSEVPSLTGQKTLAVPLVCISGVLGGYAWVWGHRSAEALDFLWPYALLSLVAGLLPNDATYNSEGLKLYAGNTANPNFLGFIVAASLPLFLWRIYCAKRKRLEWLSAGLCALGLVLLFLTVSRSAYLVFGGGLTGLLFSSQRRTLLTFVGVTGWLLLLMVTYAPELGGDWIQRNVYKSATDERTVTSSRELVWAESYEAAKQGGLQGLGAGISAGISYYGEVGMLTTFNFAREKGNSQLAIIEEAGLVGFACYLILLTAVFGGIVSGFAAATGPTRAFLGLVIGVLAGMVLSSTVEAWWVGPGSPEFVYFWTIVGVGLGVSQLAKSDWQVQSHRESASGAARLARARP